MSHPRSAGRHLILDGYVADASVFTKDNLTRFFVQLVATLEMKIILGPECIEVPIDPAVLRHMQETGVFSDSGGISTFTVISTSHLALHAWPLENKVSLDVFSCCTFDQELALAFIYKALGITRASVIVLDRRWPDAP